MNPLGVWFMDGTASKVAEFLLQIKAIKLQPDQPFTWASGWKSPIYCDNRVALSYPRVRTFIRQELVKLIESNTADKIPSRVKCSLTNQP